MISKIFSRGGNGKKASSSTAGQSEQQAATAPAASAARQQQPSQPSLPAGTESQSHNNKALVTQEHRTKGVALQVLVDLKSALDPTATFHEAKHLIKEKTKNLIGDRAWASLLEQDPTTKHLVGKATCFVSYAWRGSFHDTVDTLVDHFKDKPASYFWMDFAMVDQFAAEVIDVNFETYAETFPMDLKEIGSAVIVLFPGEYPIALRSSWMNFELVNIRQLGIPFDYCSPRRDLEKIIAVMKHDMEYRKVADELLVKVKAEKAEASKPSDQAAILKLTQEQGGIDRANDIVIVGMILWLLQVATEGQKNVERGTRQEIHLLNSKASLFQMRCDYDSALPLFELALQGARHNFPEDFELIASCLNHLARLLKDMGDFPRAISTLREAVTIRKEALGDHPSVATQINDLGTLFFSMGAYAEAEVLYREALAMDKRVLGDDHVDVARDLNNLATMLKEMREYSQADPLYREAMSIFKRALGEEHPDIATILNNLAGVLMHGSGDLLGAEAMFRECLAIRKKVFGEKSPQVGQTLNNLGSLMLRQGKRTEAKQLFEEGLKIRRKTFGDNHPEVANSLTWLAAILKDEGDRDGALLYGRMAYDIFSRCLPPSHREVIGSKNFLMSLMSPIFVMTVPSEL